MNIEELIEVISSKVLEQLKQQSKTDLSAVRPQKVLVIAASDSDKRWLCGKSRAGAEFFFLEDIEHAEADDYDCILILEMSNSLLTDVAQAIGHSRDAVIIVESLLRRKPVYLVESGIIYHQFSDLANPKLFELFQQKEQDVISFGVSLVKKIDVFNVLSSAYCHYCKHKSGVDCIELKSEDSDIFSINEKVVRERHLQAGVEQGYRRFTIQQNSIITPLASDFARLQVLDVFRIGHEKEAEL